MSTQNSFMVCHFYSYVLYEPARRYYEGKGKSPLRILFAVVQFVLQLCHIAVVLFV
jgi:hypothetical protein